MPGFQKLAAITPAAATNTSAVTPTWRVERPVSSIITAASQPTSSGSKKAKRESGAWLITGRNCSSPVPGPPIIR